MNILLINYEYPPIGAGAANATYYMAQAFKDTGHNVFVFTANYLDKKGLVNEDGVNVMRIRAMRKHADRCNIFEMSSFLFQGFLGLPSFINKTKPDFCIVFFSFPCGPLGWLAHIRQSIPYVISLRGGDVPGTEPKLKIIHQLLKPIRRKVLKHSIAVTANSESLKRLSETADPYPVVVIPNGVDTEFYSPLEKTDSAESEFSFIFVGRFQEQKNLFYLLEQFSKAIQYSQKKVRLNIVGDGPQKQDLINYSLKLGINNFVEWHGWSSKQNVRVLYRKSNCLVLPSLYEGMSNVVLEAMACGLPVIASNVAGNDALVKHNENGYFFNLSDSDAMSRLMIDIIGNPVNARQMGLAGRKMVETKYSWHSVAADYLSLFINPYKDAV